MNNGLIMIGRFSARAQYKRFLIRQFVSSFVNSAEETFLSFEYTTVIYSR